MGQYGVSDGCCQWVVVEGGVMGVWLEDLCSGFFCQYCVDWEVVFQFFGVGENVWDDVVMLVGVEMVGMFGVGLYFIEYQGGMMVIVEGMQCLQECWVCWDYFVFVDNWFDDYCVGV